MEMRRNIMSIASISTNAQGSSYETQKKKLQEDRSRELEAIEKNHQAQIAKLQEMKSNTISQLAESQAEELTDKKIQTEATIQKIKEDSDRRTEDFKKATSQLTLGAEKQYQKKAMDLDRNARELGEQQKFIIKQHRDAAKKLTAEQEFLRAKAEAELAKRTQSMYFDQQEKSSELKSKGANELSQIEHEQIDQKRATRTQGELELARLQNVRENQKQTVYNQMEFEKIAGKEQLTHLEQVQRKNLLKTQEEQESQLLDLNRGYRSQVNQEALRGKKQLQDTKDFYNNQLTQIHRENKEKVTEVEKGINRKLQNLELDGKLKDHLLTQSNSYKSAKMQEKTQKELGENIAASAKLVEHFQQDYHTKAKLLKDEQQKELGKMKEQMQKEILMQQNRGINQVENLIAQNTKKVSEHETRLKDPFYHVHRLNPNVDVKENEVLIRLEVPEQEKDSIRITLQPGGLTFTGTRRAQNKTATEDGRQVSTHTYQSYSESVPVQGKLEMNKLTRVYDNGKLWVRIPKT